MCRHESALQGERDAIGRDGGAHAPRRAWRRWAEAEAARRERLRADGAAGESARDAFARRALESVRERAAGASEASEPRERRGPADEDEDASSNDEEEEEKERDGITLEDLHACVLDSECAAAKKFGCGTTRFKTMYALSNLLIVCWLFFIHFFFSTSDARWSNDMGHRRATRALFLSYRRISLSLCLCSDVANSASRDGRTGNYTRSWKCTRA